MFNAVLNKRIHLFMKTLKMKESYVSKFKRTIERDKSFCLELLSKIKFINHFFIIPSRNEILRNRLAKCFLIFLFFCCIISGIMLVIIQREHPINGPLSDVCDVFTIVSNVSLLKWKELKLKI